MGTSADVRHELAGLADPRRAAGVSRFLQMTPGGYGEGDRAIGVSVPEQRRVAARHWRDLSLAETAKLLASGVHEERLSSLFILVRKFTKGDEEERSRIFSLILDNTDRINNWDLVDSSAPYIVGPWLIDKDRGVLDRLAEEEFLAGRYRVMLRYAIEKFEPQRRKDYLSGVV